MSKFWKNCLSSSKPIFSSRHLRLKEAIPKEKTMTPTVCKSLKFMLKHGFISSSSSGIFSLMPSTLRSLENLCILIETVMKNIGSQKVLFPTLAHSKLWQISGRWDNENSQLFKLQDRHSQSFCLSPTHEEIAASLLSDLNLSYKTFPLRLFQISPKFRDELHPRLGLLRGREFIMKDMYTFDVDEKSAVATYEDVCTAYDKIFQLLDVKYLKVKGSSAGMGGNVSHEFHLLSDVGEDELLFCPKCNEGVNAEVLNEDICQNCGIKYEKKTGIEVGHAFLLKETYTKPFNAKYTSIDNTFQILQMGCYGLGVTRILAACMECLSDAENIRWPLILCPFLVSVIPPKKGSKEEAAAVFAMNIANSLCNVDCLSDNILFDDRSQLSIGRRLTDANNIGIPYVVVASGSVFGDTPKVELHDVYNGQMYMVTHAELFSYFQNLNKRLKYKYAI